VAGFNQFYDDTESTLSEVVGIAVDQKFSKRLFGGIELSKRKLEVPLPTIDFLTFTSSLDNYDWEEKVAHAYLFYTPTNQVSLSAELYSEKLDQPTQFAALSTRTEMLPLGIRYLDSFGGTSSFTSTYVKQKGCFESASSPSCVNGDSDFWVSDASYMYRLPNRSGLISVGATNLFDEEFEYKETDLANSRIVPERMAYVRLMINLP